MLQFKEACRILEAHQSEAKEAMRDKIETRLKNVGTHASSLGQDVPEEETKSNQPAVELEDGDTPTNQNRVRASDRAEEVSPSENGMSTSSVRARKESLSASTPRASSQSIVPSLFDHIKTVEDQLRAALGRDTAILEKEVQTLKMQLEAQKERANSAKFRLDDERETREAAQEDLKKAREKMREQEEIRIRLEDERDAHEAKSQDWQKKYAGLKRKLKSLAEDEDEPTEKVAKHRALH